MISICQSISAKKGSDNMENMERLENLKEEENEMAKAHLIAILVAIKKFAEKSDNTEEIIDFINEILKEI